MVERANWANPGSEQPDGPPALDLKVDVPHSARIYDHLLGGKDNFPADRAAAAEIIKDWVHLPQSMRANRNFMARVARHLTAERGIRQFLDIGTGLPTSPNLHEVVQAVAPESRVVYVDNDPIVLVHARALLSSTPEGRTAYVDADLRDPEAILGSAQFRDTLSLDRPIALSLLAIMQFVLDDDEAKQIIDRLVEPLPPGSVLALSTVTADSAPEEVTGGVAAYNAGGIPCRARDKAEVESIFGGLTLLDPGITLVNRWRPDGSPMAEDAHVHMYGGVALKG
ncbi:MAG TPA: SAM-dependent methyltransferase [Actinoallomurus sp.]|nr:SAM-dependent methyltransferase [Actinoallomurus sp.]